MSSCCANSRSWSTTSRRSTTGFLRFALGLLHQPAREKPHRTPHRRSHHRTRPRYALDERAGPADVGTARRIRRKDHLAGVILGGGGRSHQLVGVAVILLVRDGLLLDEQGPHAHLPDGPDAARRRIALARPTRVTDDRL